MAQWFGAKEAHPDALLFFRMGDFYELFFTDAEAAASALDIALTARGEHAGAPIPMCGVPVASAETYLARLIRRGFRVAVVEQMEPPRKSGKAPMRREVVRLITPGTITEEALLDAARPNLLLALARPPGSSGEALGAAWLDVSTGLFETAPVAAAELAAWLGRLDPAEVLAAADLPLGEFEARRAPEAAPPPPLAARRKVAEAFGAADLEAFGTFSDAEAMAAALALDYVRATQAGRLPRLSRPSPMGEAGVMALDAATRASLEITRARDGGTAHTLLAAVQRTVTAPGARLLAGRLSAPLTDPAAIAALQAEWGWLLTVPDAASRLRQALRGAPDMARALGRLALGRGTPRDLAAIRDGATAGVRAAEALAGDALDGLPPGLEAARAALSAMPRIASLLAGALADPVPVRLEDGGTIAAGYDGELDAERALRDDARRVISTLQLDYAQRYGVASLKLRHHAQLGYVIEVPAVAVEKLSAHPELTLRQGMANGARFTAPDLVELNRRIVEAADRAASRERAVFAALTARVLDAADAISAAADALARLDVAQSAARLAEGGSWCRPVVREDAALLHHGRAAPGGGGGARRRCRLRAERLRSFARTSRAPAHRPQHGRQIHLSAAERAARDPRPGRAARARAACGDRHRGPALLAGRRVGRSRARAQHLHGGDDRDRRDPAPGRPAQLRDRGRDRARHGDARRARHRLGGAGGAAFHRALPHDLRHAFPRARGAGTEPRAHEAPYDAGARVEGQRRLPARGGGRSGRAELGRACGETRRRAGAGAPPGRGAARRIGAARAAHRRRRAAALRRCVARPQGCTAHRRAARGACRDRPGPALAARGARTLFIV